MEKIIIIMFTLFSYGCSSASAINGRCNVLIMGIHDDILNIKNDYEELKNYGDGSLKNKGLLSIDYGSPVKKAFPEKGEIWIQIFFDKTPFQSGLEEFTSNDFYIKEFKLYLRCKIWATPELKNKLLEIIKKNLTTQSPPTGRQRTSKRRCLGSLG